jgi:lauroyl/myristoyl acyltransferase
MSCSCVFTGRRLVILEDRLPPIGSYRFFEVTVQTIPVLLARATNPEIYAVQELFNPKSKIQNRELASLMN